MTTPAAHSASDAAGAVPDQATPEDSAAPAQQFPQAPTSFFRPVVISAVLVVITMAVASFGFGANWVGPWAAVGAALALLNTAATHGAVKNATRGSSGRRGPVAASATTRLTILSIIALVIAYFFAPQGLGVVFGLAVTHLILVLNTVIPVVKGLRQK